MPFERRDRGVGRREHVHAQRGRARPPAAHRGAVRHQALQEQPVLARRLVGQVPERPARLAARLDRLHQRVDQQADIGGALEIDAARLEIAEVVHREGIQRHQGDPVRVEFRRGRRQRGVEHAEELDLLALREQLRGDLVGDQPAEGPARHAIRPLGLDPAHHGHETRRDRLQRARLGFAERERRQPIHRDRGVDVGGQVLEIPRVALQRVGEEQRPLAPLGVEHHVLRARVVRLAPREFAGRRAGRLDQGREPVHRARIEDAAHRQAHAGLLAGAHRHLRRHQRMAADREEVVVPADPLEPQRRGPDPRQQGFEFAHRRLVAARGKLGRAGIERAQREPVELAVRQQRHGRERREAARHHRRGQALCQPGMQRAGVELGTRPRHVVRHQLQFAAQFAPDRGGRRQLRMRGQLQLDGGQLDALPAHLDLEVLAPQVQQLSVGQPQAEIAGAQQPGARRGMTHEALGRQVGPVPVAGADRVALDVQHAHGAHRHRREPLVEQVDAAVGDRPPRRCHRVQRGQLGALAIADVVQLAAAVVVVQASARQRGGEAPGQAAAERLACGGDVAQRAQLPGMLEQHGQVRGHQVQARHAMRLEGRREGRRVLDHRVGQDHLRHARQQPRQHLLDGGHEGHRGLLGDHLVGRVRRALPEGLQAVHQLAVLDHHALGLPGRTRGVGDVGEIVGPGRRRLEGRLRVELAGLEIGFEIGFDVEPQHRRAAGLERRRQHGRGDDRRRHRVVQRAPHVGGGIAGVDRHVGGAQPERGQDRGHEAGRARVMQGDPRAGADPAPMQRAGDASGQPVQLGVARDLALEHAGRRIGTLGQLPREQRVHAGAWIGAPRVVRARHQRLLGRRRLAQRRQRGLGRVGHANQQFLQHGQHEIHLAGIEAQAVVVGHQFEPLAVAEYLQVQVRLRLAVDHLLLHRQREPAAPVVRLDGRHVLVPQHHRHRRASVVLAQRRHGRQHVLERQRLVFQRLQHALARPGQQGRDIGLARQVQAQRQDIDEEADQRLQQRVVAPGGGGADAEVLAAAAAMMQHAQRDQEDGEQAHAALPAQLREPAR
ncbi:Uncharacterised protein [Burkholderia gladioli]|nr:Uncharacterised protein [Burkholderia gladioli]